jgi:Flp pilus assembly protein TadD
MSLGRLQLQAEEYGAATGAFGRVLRYDEENPWALVGRALAQARLRRTRGAERSLQDARDAKEDRDMTDAREDRFDARVHLVRGWLRYKDERWGGARSHAKRALRLDPEEGRAHVLLASVASERDRDPKPHLRKALKARTPPPEAKAMLALELGETEEGCEFAKAYHEAAPGGRRARSIRRMRFRCRKKFG